MRLRDGAVFACAMLITVASTVGVVVFLATAMFTPLSPAQLERRQNRPQQQAEHATARERRELLCEQQRAGTSRAPVYSYQCAIGLEPPKEESTKEAPK